MKRMTKREYKQRVLVLMAIYVALMLIVWPYTRTAQGLALRTLFALLPAVPVLCVIVLMARRVMRSDELEQRLHMGALGIATAIVCVASLVGGFLAAAHVLPLGGDVLIWIVPLVCISYAGARWWLARRYGGMDCE